MRLMLIMEYYNNTGTKFRVSNLHHQILFEINAPCLVTISKWYRRFQTEHFSVEADPREGRPNSSTGERNVSLVKAKTDEETTMIQQMIVYELGITAMAFSRILKNILEWMIKKNTGSFCPIYIFFFQNLKMVVPAHLIELLIACTITMLRYILRKIRKIFWCSHYIEICPAPYNT